MIINNKTNQPIIDEQIVFDIAFDLLCEGIIDADEFQAITNSEIVEEE